MNKRNARLLGTLTSALLLQSTFAEAATLNRYIWSSSRGLQKAENCSITSQDQIPLYLVEKDGRIQDGVVSTANLQGIKRTSLKELSESILDLKGSNARGKIEGRELSDTLLQAAFDDSGSDYATLLCKTSEGRNGFALFNVFAPGKEDPIAQLAISKGDAEILRNVKVHSVEEAMQIVQSRMQQPAATSMTCNTCPVPSTTSKQTPAVYTLNGQTPGESKSKPNLDESDARVAAVNTSIVQQAQVSAAAAQANTSKIQASGEISNVEATEEGQAIADAPKSYVVCSPTADVRIRDASLKRVLFNANRLEQITLKQRLGSGKRMQVDGKAYSFIEVEFSARKQKQSGFIAEQMIKTADQCSSASVAQTPTTTTKPAAPTATTTKPADSTSVAGVNAPSCAARKILASAKTNVARRWRNNPSGTGACALGVRQSLQASGVGGISGGLGNAIDMVGPLKARGFVELSVRDASQVPAGAVMIFSGPNTSSYLKNHRMRRPYGNYVGHITIKGDDGFYYTDGRTAEPAIGWSRDKNVAGRRNLYAVLVPGPTLVEQYVDSCK